MARALPLKGPCILRASKAYSEQLGVNRHEGGKNGDTKRRYPQIGALSSQTPMSFKIAFMTLLFLFRGVLWLIGRHVPQGRLENPLACALS